MAHSNHGTGATNAASMSDTTTNPLNSQQDKQVIPTGEMDTVIQPVKTTQPTQTSSSSPSAASTAAPTSQAIPTSGTTASTVATITQVMPTVGENSNKGVWNFGKVSHRFVPPGRPTTSMLGLHTGASTFSQNLHAQLPPLYTTGVSVPFPTPQQSLTNNSLAALRQQMEESNHEMVNMVTQQIGTVINPYIRETNTSYQLTTTPVKVPTERNTDQLTENRALRRTIPPPAQREPERFPVLVKRRQDANCHRDFRVSSH